MFVLRWVTLLDVEGYPVNIAYHGGVGMEQKASWVDLGWNISPGSVNCAIRGLPDDFAGDTIEKELSIKPWITQKIGFVVNAELFGFGDPIPRPDINLGGYLTMSNYRGVSVDFTELPIKFMQKSFLRSTDIKKNEFRFCGSW